jgi:lipid A 3-O-deacylase
MSFRRLKIAMLVMTAVAPLRAGLAAETQQTRSLSENLRNAFQGRTPHETALGFYAGTAYDWSDMSFCMASVQVLYDHDAIWPHRAPDGLGIRLEANAGAATGTEFSGDRFVTSGNFLAVYEFSSPKETRVVPYVEAGAGLIYTDFQRQDQAYRLNFNPVAGLGVRMGSTFLVLRLHHLSNGGLNDDNRGINSIVLGLGIYLGSNK